MGYKHKSGTIDENAMIYDREIAEICLECPKEKCIGADECRRFWERWRSVKEERSARECDAACRK